jgi:PAS domain S-box-containing protein
MHIAKSITLPEEIRGRFFIEIKQTMKAQEIPIPFKQKTILTIFLLALLAAGAWFFRIQQQAMHRAVETNLSAIVRLKVDQVAAWRRERLEDGLDLMNRPFLTKRMARWLQKPHEGELEIIRAELRTFQRKHDYADVLLVDPQGRLLISLSGSKPIHHGYVTALLVALRDRSPVLTDLHKEEQYSIPHISIVAPILSVNEQTKQPLGAIILVSEASRGLYPLIQSWPTPSQTAETVLIQQEGEAVLFLNDLRHQPGSALNLRIPLHRTDQTSVMAVKGHQGVFEGKDYRGVAVISVILPVPESPWFMVAKMDTAEAFAEWRFRAILIMAFLLCLTGMVSVFALVIWQREKKNHYRRLYQSEAALRASERRHSITLRSIADGVIVTDANGQVELLNAVAEKLTGWSQEQAQGKPLTEVFRIIDEKTRADVENPLSRVLREGLVVGLANHTLLIARNGTERPIADSGAPICDEKGQIAGMVVVFRDMTKEYAYQKKISESERKYRALYNSIRDAILVADTNRMVIDCNPAFFDLFGYLPEDIIGKNTIEIYENEKAFKAVGEALQAHGRNFSDFLYTGNFRKKSGEVFPGESKIYYLRNDSGTLIGAIGLIRDLTQRKQAEAERDRLLAAIEQTREMILITDTRGVIQYVNPAFESVTGYSRRETIGQTPRFLKSGQQDAAFYRTLWETIASGKTWEGRLVNKRKDGTIYTEEATISPVYDTSQHITSYVAAKRDITKQLQMAAQFQQAQKMESIGRLAGGVAHDYNNMLSVIIGYAEMAMNRIDPNDPLQADIREIFNAATRSAEITQQLLAFARKQTIVPQVLDLNETVQGTLNMLKRLLGEDIDLAWRPAEGLWPIKMDPAQIGQILANLCVNARDAIAGVGKITVETRNVAFDEDYCTDHAGFIPGQYVLMAVSDDGCGMDKETLDKIFEPFFTTKTVGRGTGLGLATVYGIVKQNYGFINVYSEPGKGTTFKVYLARHASQTTEIRKEAAAQIPRGRGETILVVEDEKAILQLARTMLTGLGYTVLAAGTPDEALRLAGHYGGRIHLLITDVVMPGMNGRELAARLQAIYPDLRHLFMSGYTANVIAHQGVLDEGVHFLQKPFSMGELASKVRNALDQSMV